VLQGLSYCNHCGSNLSLVKQVERAQLKEISPESLLWAIVSVFLGGMGIIIGLMAVMQNVLHFNIGLISFFVLLSFLMMTIIEIVFIWRFIAPWRALNKNEPAQLTAKAKLEQGTLEARALPEPLHSVTDQTTRSFEPVLRKQPGTQPVD